MTWRSILIGLGVATAISAATYYNDMVVRSGLLVFHLLAPAVFGGVLLLAMLWNVAVARLRRSVVLRPRELAVILAIALCACSLPDAGFWRTATTNLVMPGYRLPTKPAWHATDVMKYLPGGSPLLAAGHVREPRAFAQRWIEASDGPLARMWSMLDEEERRLVAAIAAGNGVGDAPQTISRVLNGLLQRQELDALIDVDVDEEAEPVAVIARRRDWLHQQAPEHVLPASEGGPLLLYHGHEDPHRAEQIILGASTPEGSGDDAGWSWWAPLLRLWGPAAVLLAITSLMLSLIFHAQWSNRERLAYPIARVIAQALATEPGAALPRVLHQRSFWCAFVAVALLHTLNGLNVWFPHLPKVSLLLNFDPLRQLFPNASAVPDSQALFSLWIYPTAVAFAYFLSTPVSFSVALAPLAYVCLAATLVTSGVTMNTDYIAADKANLLRFGAYAAMLGVILYNGRRYYLHVAQGVIGAHRHDDVSPAVAWAARVAIVCCATTIWLLARAGLDLLMAGAFVALALMTFVVIARIVAETGLFLVQAWWLPVGVLTAMLGFDALGPETYLVLGLASTMLVGDTRTVLMGYAVNGLRLIQESGDDDAAGSVPRRAMPWMMIAVVVGFMIAGVTTIALQHRHGLLGGDQWSVEALPAMPFDKAAQLISAQGDATGITESLQLNGLTRLFNARPDRAAWAWLGIGAALVFACGAARLHLAWWPIHPVLFLIWGTYGANRYAFSFLLGGLIKLAVVRTIGARGFHQLLPFMVGVVVGELVLSFAWLAVGWITYLATGQHPASYFMT